MKSLVRHSFCAAALGIFWTSVSLGQIPWVSDLEDAQRQAVQTGKPILVHFYTDNCPPCKSLEMRAFRDPKLVYSLQQNVIPVRINAEQRHDLAAQFNVNRWPTDVFLAANGQEIHRTISQQDPILYNRMIDHIAIRNRDWMLDRTTKLAAIRSNLNDAGSPYQQTATVPTANTFDSNSDRQVRAHLVSQPVSQGLQNGGNGTVRTQPPQSGKSNYGEPGTSVPSKEQPKATPQPTVTNRYRGGSMANNPNGIGPRPNAQFEAAPASPQPALVQNPFANQSPPSFNPPPLQMSNPQFNAPDQSRAIAPNTVLTSPTAFQTVAHPTPHLVSPPLTPVMPLPTFGQPTNNQPTHFQPTNNQPISNQPTNYQLPSQQLAFSQPTTSEAANLQTNNTLTPPPRSPQLVVAPTQPLASVELDQTLGLEGFCPIALGTRKAWHLGDPNFAVRHRGRIYNCESEEARQVFLGSPDQFSPILSGYDPVHFLESGRLIEGKRGFGCWCDSIDGKEKRMLLFADLQSRTKYNEQAEYYMQRLQRLMENVEGKVAEQQPNNGSLVR